MKQWIRRGAALGLALALTVTAASASQAMGWDVHTGRAPLSQGASLGKNVFWSDTYSDLRTEYYVEYSPNASVVPTVAYGSKVTDRVTLSGMAQTLESQGKRVVSGLNGDWYVLSTGAPTGLVVTDGIVRATGYYNDTWAIGFNADGTAFIARNGLSVSVSFGGQAVKLGGGINKVRKLTDSAAVGGLTLLTDDFAATTQNTEPGVDVILSPVDDGTGTYAVKPTIGRQTQYVVEQVLESTGSIPIPEGRAHPERQGERGGPGPPAGPSAGGYRHPYRVQQRSALEPGGPGPGRRVQAGHQRAGGLRTGRLPHRLARHRHQG